jgi:hypothetical protein
MIIKKFAPGQMLKVHYILRRLNLIQCFKVTFTFIVKIDGELYVKPKYLTNALFQGDYFGGENSNILCGFFQEYNTVMKYSYHAVNNLLNLLLPSNYNNVQFDPKHPNLPSSLTIPDW